MKPLQYVPYRFLLAGRTVNALGNSFAPIALAFAVLDLTGSAGDLGLVVGARTLANVLFLLFGGVLADRLPRHLLMVGSNAAAAVTQAAVAVLVLTGAATIPLLIALSVVNGVTAAVALPASAALLPLTVPEGVRLQAIAVSRIALNGAMVLGAPVAGVVVAATDPGVGIAVDAAAFVVAGLCFALIRVTMPARSAERSNVFADLWTGWSEFRSRTWLWVVVAGFSLLNAAWSGGLYVLGPVVADQTIGRPAWGLVLAAETAGMILGGLLAIRLKLRRLLLVGVVSCFGMALPLFVLGGHPQLWALFLAMFVTGLTLEQFGVAWETTMQEHVPADRLARVYSYDMVGSFAAIPLGQVAIGPIAEVTGPRAALIGAGVVAVVAVLGMLASRDVRTLRHRLPEAEPRPVSESVP
ncbi:MFS transporter [Actinoplanes sp. NPDC026670]|uniref:MFS transporter n=1 Tax=Actinoplanes sp. NPDC026670 TaxID=3154700 RepID=UPI0033EB9747